MLFDQFMESFHIESETCPICKCKGSCSPHGFYKRKIIDFTTEGTTSVELTVRRVICHSCGRHHTHAILPDFIVPYASYGLFFILRVLGEYFLHRYTIEQICSVYDISIPVLYRWIRLFREHKKSWLGLLTDRETQALSFLKGLILSEDYSRTFAAPFVLLTAHSFLQGHANPAIYRQTVF